MRVTLILATTLLATAAQAQGFCDKVKALANEPAVAAAHWGVSVTALDGTVLCSLNEAQLFRPASNNKLFTMAAALALLGPDRTFTTSVMAAKPPADGVLTGDLQLFGGGDPDFGSTDIPYIEPSLRPKEPVPESVTIKDIEELADQVYASGVRSITGDVVGDDRYFTWEPYPIGWGVDDLNTDYGVPVSALTIHDNTAGFDLGAGAEVGTQGVISPVPDVPYFTVQSAGFLTSFWEGEPMHANVYVQRAPLSRTIGLYGNIPKSILHVKVQTAIDDPAEYAALALKQALERRGVTIAGKAKAWHDHQVQPIGAMLKKVYDAKIDAMVREKLVPEAGKVVKDCSVLNSDHPAGFGPILPKLATHTSPRLADDVLYTLKESQNLHAEILLGQLGSAFACDTTRSSSLVVLRSYLQQIGVVGTDFVEYDGSGLSGHDLVAPRAFTQLLVYAAKQTWFDTFKNALPVGGVDGTLASRFAAPASKLAGKVLAKTGTLGESRALAGYVTAASGTTVVFSVMVDNHPPGTTADRTAMDKMVEAIAAGN